MKTYILTKIQQYNPKVGWLHILVLLPPSKLLLHFSIDFDKTED